MNIKIPFTKYGINIEKRGIQIVDRQSSLPMSFDAWRNKFSLQDRSPILENIYSVIASEFSKIDLILSQDTANILKNGYVEHIYIKQMNNPNYDILALRPNMLQTKSELLYTIAYQLHMYGNSLVKIIRQGNIVTALEPLNMDDYYFGEGYEVGDSLYLKLKEKKTNKIILLNYNDVIHLRSNPNDMFYGDKSNKVDLTHFVKLFDENLNVLLNELKEAGAINGVIELGGNIAIGNRDFGGFNSALIKSENKVSKQKEIIERIKATKGGILVLDAGEKWTSLPRTFNTMSKDEVDNLMKYLYNFKGINQKVIDGTASEAEMEVFFNKTIMPIIERFLEELNYKFLSFSERKEGFVIEYFKNPFEYMATKDLLSNLYLGAMYFTQNEVRRMAFKLHPLDGGDVLIDNKNFTKTLNSTNSLKGGENENGKEDS